MPSTTSTSQPARNRLAAATSPYLLQHADNPVDWYEWGAEALERARREDKPIFLSIGYSACHWCHVMAHESFENPAIAGVMNRYFVNIKVDREERPDLDEIYMQATMLVNQGQGGWPMSVWLTPELKPFYAGTYFPPEPRFGRPGFGEFCERIGRLWAEKREAIASDAEKLSTLVADSLKPQPAGEAAFTLELVDRTSLLLARAFDPERGGLLSGGTNKFPPSLAMDLMLRTAHRRPAGDADGARLVGLVALTLEHMARGGIYDHLGGGIARYSTDPEWLVPHFEKMLYDQALVSRIYVDAWQKTKNPLYARVARETFDYVIADLQSPGGGLYSTRDADSEGEEGRYYVWTRPEIVAALGERDGAIFCAYYGVTETGNWSDPHAPGVAKNILHVARDAESVAKLHGVARDELERILASGRAKLLAVRATRVPPGRDDKILCEWNGLMIASLARGGAVLGERRFVDAAARAAEFVLKNQVSNGRLMRAWRDGRRLETAFLSDYACMIEGLIELYEATFDRRWLDRAVELNRTAIRLFHDDRHGGFFFTPHDHEALIARSKDVRDSAVPSGNSVQLMNLLRLATMLDDAELRRLADRSMAHYAADVLSQPGSSERYLQAVDFALAGPTELAVVGDPADVRTQALLRAVHDVYLPNRVLMLLNPNSPTAGPALPLLRDRGLVDGAPAVYICRNYTCQRPLTRPEDVRAALGGAAATTTAPSPPP